MRKALVLAAATFLALTASPAFAGRDWDVIAVREVSDKVETDHVTLPGDRQFSRIKICVARHPVSIKDVDIHFRNGGHQDVDFGTRVAAGDCTRTIDLEGGTRNIDYIKLRYEETSARRATATIRILAK